VREGGPSDVVPTEAAVGRRDPAAQDLPNDLSEAPERTIELLEERLRAETRPVQVGELRIRKELVTEVRTIEVSVTREELVVERHPVDRRAPEPTGSGDDPLAARFAALQPGEVLRLPIVEEEVVVTKRPVVVEEVRIGKRRIEESKQVSGTVRRQRLVTEQGGDVRLADSTPDISEGVGP
jgi:uncharacterized protein (TIGR02271 family)